MPIPLESTLADIDWSLLWRNARKQKSWSSKGAADWDKKAESFASRNAGSCYSSLLLDKLPLTPDLTVLDMGSGPGTLAIPLAARVRSVTAVDYSSRMLEVLTRTAQEENIANISTIQGAWEDDWQQLGIGQHDIAIASRSLAVEDLAAALRKLNAIARKYVFIADRITPTPFDPGAFAAVGRDFQSGPDYIYTFNILYSLGIHPCIDILHLERDIVFANMDEAVQAYGWMLKDLSPKEEDALRGYLVSRIIHTAGKQITIRREHPPRWALIWWRKEITPEAC
ncbi:MAG TPA: class I SAM-dependent methyltransferase [Desulfobulbaceae bacterium]|nr:class I SAM-dependent methyltransferase [Desulfobulbaceae bacterium]